MSGDSSKPLSSERAFLSCCLLNPSLIDENVAQGRTSKIFSGEAEAATWELLIQMRQRDLGIEVTTLAQMAMEEGSGDLVTPFYVAKLGEVVSTTVHAATFMTQILAGYKLRVLRASGQKIAIVALEATSFGIAHQSIECELTRIGNLTLEEREASLVEDVDKVIDGVRAELTGECTYSNELYTGLRHFDATLGPIDVEQFEDYVVLVAAGPSVGKSSLTRSIAYENIERGRKGAVFLLETTRRKYLKLMASQKGKVDLRHLKEYAELHKENFAEFAKTLKALKNTYADKNLFVYDNHYSIEEIESRIRYLAAREGHLDFVVIDYVQLVTSGTRHGSREQEVAEISRRIKIVAKDLKLTIFAVAQLNREGRKLDRPPVKEDLRESGSLEQDADRILLLYRPNTYKGTRKGEKVEISQDYNNAKQRIFHVDVIQDKCRNGPTGKSSVLFERNYTLFYDYPNVDENGQLRTRKEYS